MSTCTRRLWVLAKRALLVAALSASVVIAGSRSEAADRLVQMHFPGSVMSLPVYVAKEKGYYKKHNLDVELVGFNSGPDAVAAVLSGSVDFMINSGDNIMRSMDAGSPPFKIVVGNLGRIPFTVVARKDLPTPNIGKPYPAPMRDLKGHVVGIQARGGSVEFFLRALIRDAGLNPDKDVKWAVVGPPPTAVPAFANKQIDAYLAFEPFQTRTLSELKIGKVLVDLRKGQGPREFKNFPYNFYSGRADRVMSRPDFVKRYVAAMFEAQNFIHDPANLDELVTISQKYMKMDKGLLRQMLVDNVPTFSPYVTVDGMRRWIDFARSSLGIKRKFTPQELLATEFLPKPK